MTDRELMQEALYALTYVGDAKEIYSDTIESLRARLAQPEQEPVAWWHDMGDVVDLNVSGRGIPLYTAPPQREWQGLTRKQLLQIWGEPKNFDDPMRFARAIEAKLKDKNEY